MAGFIFAVLGFGTGLVLYRIGFINGRARAWDDMLSTRKRELRWAYSRRPWVGQ